MAMNVNTLESYFPAPGVQHAAETIDATVRQLGALDADTRLVVITPNVAIRVTFDDQDPVTDTFGHVYNAGETVPMNEVTAAAMKWTRAYTGDADGSITVSEMKRT